MVSHIYFLLKIIVSLNKKIKIKIHKLYKFQKRSLLKTPMLSRYLLVKFIKNGKNGISSLTNIPYWV